MLFGHHDTKSNFGQGDIVRGAVFYSPQYQLITGSIPISHGQSKIAIMAAH